jgi:hypothetical protein
MIRDGLRGLSRLPPATSLNSPPAKTPTYAFCGKRLGALVETVRLRLATDLQFEHIPANAG